MKNKFVSLLGVVSPLFLVVGDLGLFFTQTMFAGYLLFALGCITGLVAVAAKSRIDVSERFHLLTSIVGLIVLGLFVFTGALNRLVIALLILFVVDFLIMLIDLREPNNNQNKTSEKKSERYNEKSDRELKKNMDEYKKYNEKKLFDELENIKDEFSHVQIYEAGNVSDIEDLSLRKKAQDIKNELEGAVVVEDPKEGRFFYKENAKMFHVKDCAVLSRVNKKELKASNSRTELLAKGYKSCKVCNS